MEQTDILKEDTPALRPKRYRAPDKVPRKKSVRKFKRRRHAERIKERLKDPAEKAALVARLVEGRRKNPEKAFRFGVPDGMRREQAVVEWAKASKKADWIMEELEKGGIVQFDPNMPEEEMARKALWKAFEYIFSPMANTQMRHAHIRTVLEWTKAKPATKTDLRLNNAEAWLEEVVKDHRATNDSIEGST